MTTPTEKFFATMSTQGGVIVPDMPKLDLDSYIQNYKGPTKYDRLFLIGRCSVPLCIDALKAAHSEAKKGKNVNRYKEVWSYLRLVAPDDPRATFDESWAESTEAANTAETKRLEREMKVYKNNLVKESIRMGHEELGKHLESIGDLTGATEAYNRMRPDVSTSKHLVDLSRHLVSVAMQRREWSLVISQLNKISGLQDNNDEKLLQPYTRSLAGLALLAQEKLEAAAKSFLEVDSSVLVGVSISKVTGGFLSANDIAVYGGLLALATMGRKDLQTKVLENSKFRTFLELEPHIRRAISQFVNGRYAACLSILASYRTDWLLDLYLQKHVDTIFSQIRCKCITNYLAPFSCATLESMNAAFSAPGESIESELASMIRNGAVNARIDSVNKLVKTGKKSPRVKMHKDALDSISQYERDALDRIRRVNIVAAELEVRAPRKSATTMHDMGGQWYGSSTPVAE